MPAAARPPPPFSPLCTPFARKGGARGHVAPGPSLGRTALYRATRPPTPPFPIHAGAHEGTPLRIASAPSRSLFAPPRSREKGARDPPDPSLLHRAQKGGARGEGHPAPLPVATGPSPSPLTAPPCTRARHPRPHSRGRGGAQRHAAPGTSLPPWPRHPVRAGRGTRDSPLPPAPPLPPSTAPPCTRGKGSREGTPPLAPPFPFAQKGRARGARRRRHLPSSTPPCTRRKGARKGTRHAPRDPTLPIRTEGARTRDSPFPLAAPLRTHGQGARKAKPPHPVAPHSRGKGRTRPPASLRVAQQDQRRLCVPAFTAPAPRFRTPLYDLDKK
ncbi:hypothetical protein EDB84DRAFT_1442242 [Lactarius hengduanensis]|nr:hypothetical protein EDB84DRAFT_1442242 [Lactarius hengduanensis]